MDSITHACTLSRGASASVEGVTLLLRLQRIVCLLSLLAASKALPAPAFRCPVVVFGSFGQGVAFGMGRR